MTQEQIKKLFESPADISLTPEERAHTRGILTGFMVSHPVRGTELERLNLQRPSYSSIYFKFMPIFAVIMIAALLGGGVSSAAEATLPGDVLYPIKVHVNETVRSLVAVSPQAAADWHVQLASRRLDEAEHLAVENRLDAQTQAGLAVAVSENAKEANKGARELEQKKNNAGAAEVDSNLEATLNAHARVLRNLANATTSLGGLIDRVDAEARTATEARIKSEDKVGAEVGANMQNVAEVKMKVAADILEQTQAALTEQRSALSADASASATAELQAAAATYAAGQAQMTAKSYRDAFGSFQKTIRQVRAVTLELKAEGGLNLKMPIRVNLKKDAESKSGERGNTTSSEAQTKTEIQGKAEVNQGLQVRTNGSGATGQTETKATTDTQEQGRLNLKLLP